jgi:hypothetical protein
VDGEKKKKKVPVCIFDLPHARTSAPSETLSGYSKRRPDFKAAVGLPPAAQPISLYGRSGSPLDPIVWIQHGCFMVVGEHVLTALDRALDPLKDGGMAVNVGLEIFSYSALSRDNSIIIFANPSG